MRYWLFVLAAVLIGLHFIPKPEGRCLSWLDGECIKTSFR